MTSIFKCPRRWGLPLAAAAMVAVAALPIRTNAAEPRSLAVLGVGFENDNAMYEPTSAAEKARLAALAKRFSAALGRAGVVAIRPVPAEMKTMIDEGQTLGACGGCELDYGTRLGTDLVAWINVQKVSNLILNMNVYIADVNDRRMTFARSIDIRGNTDEMWTRAMDYLLANYVLPEGANGKTSPAF